MFYPENKNDENHVKSNKRGEKRHQTTASRQSSLSASTYIKYIKGGL
jgi:hypothetical protein